MPGVNPVPPLNGDDSLRAYTTEEVNRMEIEWRGIRDGSTPTLSFEISGNRATATCFVNPEEFESAVLYFVGLSVVVTPGSGDPWISRLLPFRLPGREGFVCTKITKASGHKFTGKQPGVNWVGYKKVEMELLFEVPKYELFEDEELGNEYDRYVEPQPNDWTSETISTFGSNFKFARDPGGATPTAAPHGQPVPTNSCYKVQPKESFTMTWWRVPYDAISDDSDLWARIQGTGEQDDIPLVGAINSAAMFGRPTGTVFLKGVRRTLDVSPVGDGTKEWRVDYSFETLPSGWNWLWWASASDPDTNGYYMVSSDGAFATAATVGDKQSFYAARDLGADLFRP